MATTTFSPEKTVAPKNRNLSTDLERMAVVRVWDSMMRGARNIMSVTSPCENTDLVNHDNVI